jgi:hypothetical protein
MLDSSVACWDNKRAFDSERPITAIHFSIPGFKFEVGLAPTLVHN